MCDTSNALVRPLVLWITQCYLPPDRGDSHAFTPAYAGTHLSTPEGWKAELTWVAGYTNNVYPQTVTHPSINRARRRVTTLMIETNALPLSQATTYKNVFKLLVKQSSETIARSENGRLFHARGAATVNVRSPSDEYVRGTATVPNSADLSPTRVCCGCRRRDKVEV